MKEGKINWNTIAGFVLIAGILFYFGVINPTEVEVLKPEISQDSTAAPIQKEAELIESAKLDEDFKSRAIEALDSAESDKYAEYGDFSATMAQNSEEQIVTIENELLRVDISNFGAQIKEAELKNFRTWDSLPLYLINKNAAFNLSLSGDNKIYNSFELNYSLEKIDAKTVSLELKDNNGGVLVFKYYLKNNDYMLHWDIISNSFKNHLGSAPILAWEQEALRHEKNLENEGINTELEFLEVGEESPDNLSASGQDDEIANNIKWVAYKQQFFSSILLNKSGQFDTVGISSVALEQENITKKFRSNLALNTTASELSLELGLYLGPNKYDILESYDQNFDKLIPLGWGILGWINRGIVINVFNWLEGYGLSYGIIILIIALIIKVVIFPLTYTSYKSMAKMRVLKPEIEELNEKHKDSDAMKKQQATMELYKKAGVNPLGGCIPMLLQFPILIALFRFFPSSIELRQQPFLWADDLSTYDSIYNLPFDIPFYGDHISLFTLLMTVSTLIYTYMNQQLTGQNQQYPQMKYIVYLMPVIFLGVFNNYAAGLSYYYFVSNVITFSQQFAIRKFLDDDKIHAKMQEKKKNPGKESRLMRRMKEVQENQNRQQRRTNK